MGKKKMANKRQKKEAEKAKTLELTAVVCMRL